CRYFTEMLEVSEGLTSSSSTLTTTLRLPPSRLDAGIRASISSGRRWPVRTPQATRCLSTSTSSVRIGRASSNESSKGSLLGWTLLKYSRFVPRTSSFFSLHNPDMRSISTGGRNTPQGFGKGRYGSPNT
ncbi:MAG: hypothetical protein AVDCRST_MAG37-731, partial [uncultured Rubrobacteraceae bacterium]